MWRSARIQEKVGAFILPSFVLVLVIERIEDEHEQEHEEE